MKVAEKMINGTLKITDALGGKFLCRSLRTVCLQEPQVVLACVQLLQSLSQHRQHLKDLPTKTIMDILTEVTAAPLL